MKHLTVILKNEMLIDVKGETINDVPTSINGNGWTAFEQLNGKMVQIRSEEIVAIYEYETEQ